MLDIGSLDDKSENKEQTNDKDKCVDFVYRRQEVILSALRMDVEYWEESAGNAITRHEVKRSTEKLTEVESALKELEELLGV